MAIPRGMAMSRIFWLILQLNSLCTANLMKGRHTATLARHTFRIEQFSFGMLQAPALGSLR